MKNTKHILLIFLLASFAYTGALNAQCYETLGSASNMLSTVSNRPNQIIVNNDLNTVIFIHRNDISLFGGDNGVYKYDISTDNGATWQLNQGNLNPGSTFGVNGGRYPQVGIYNPPGNADLTAARLVYQGPTNSGTDWNGYVTGSLLLDGSSTATENYNQAGVSNTQIPGGFCQSAPGTFWTVDIISDDDFSATGIRILKGTYASGDVAWSVNAELTPDFNLDTYGTPALADWNMAFDPSGMKGWVVLLTHINGLPDYNYHPVFYNTTDGGATWNGPVQLDLNSFASITSVESNPACGPEVDIEVDMNGNPHALVGVFRKAGYAYGINPTPIGHLFDFTYNGATWSANKVGQLSNHSLIFPGSAYLNNRPQISRSDDGSKMVFTWAESDIPSSSGVNPNLKAVTYDVPTGNMSCPVIYSLRCPSSLDGMMYQTSVSPNMIEAGGVYTVPVVLTIANVSGIGTDPAQFYYLNDLSFTAAEFSAANSPTYPTITADGPLQFCAPGSVNLTASASSSYLWSTGETTQTINATGGNYWVINPESNTCVGSSNSANVYAVPAPDIFATGTVICPSGSVDLYVFTLNPVSSILWSTGETTDFITVTTPGSYYVSTDGCPSLYTVDITAGSTPANDNICNAQALTIGAVTPFDITCGTVEAGEPVPPLDATFNPQTQDGWNDDSYTGTPVINNTVWFSFIAPATRAVNILTDGMDTQLALYKSSNYSCTGTLTLISANDDGGSFGGSLINRAYCLEKGKRYFIQVDGALYGYQFQGTILVTAVPNSVTICHNPLSENPQTLTVSGCALADHSSHGDVIGACPSARIGTSDDVTTLSLMVYPNPANDMLNISFTSEKEENYTMSVVDVTGRVILSETKNAVEGDNNEALNLQSVSSGVYFLILNKGDNTIYSRIVKQ
jgi:hypothetical protein